MSLDCQTPRGRGWIAQQRRTAQDVAARWGVEVVQTPDDQPAAVDALFTRGGVLVGVAEIKCRTLTLAGLERFGDYLVTADKLQRGIAVASACGVPYALIVRLVDAIVWWRVADASGRALIGWQEHDTETRATCNGGAIVRRNAYLPLDDMGRLVLAEAKAKA